MTNINDPLGSALHDAAEARQETLEKVTMANTRGDDYGARVAYLDGQEAVRRHRARAIAGAAATVQRETQRLFGMSNALHAHRDPAREYALASRIHALVAGLDTPEAASKAYDRLLRTAHQSPDALALAGGLAAAALDMGWDEIVSAWVSSPTLGGAHGGWATVQRIRDARRIVAGDLPLVVRDLPPLEDLLNPPSRASA